MLKKSLQIFLIIIAFLFSFNFAKADWDSQLKSFFDHAESFDSLADWKGHDVNGEFYYGPPGSIFNGFSYWENILPTTNWIQDFGAGNKITGKSLQMDYNETVGPGRFFAYIGDGTPQSGYDDLYTFFRVKFADNFFATDNSRSYQKFFVFFTGFKSAGEWGSDEDRILMCDDAQTLKNYGGNFLMMNLGYYGSLHNVATLHPRATLPDQECWATGTKARGYRYYNYTDATHWMKDNDRAEGDGTFDLLNYEDQWLGFEMHASMNPDSGNIAHDRYGDWEFWVYDASGNPLHHWKAMDDGYITPFISSNLTRLPSSSYFPTHKFNKVEIGGNISPPALVGSYYVDDFIIDNQKIGENYFSLLNSNNDVTAPKEPTNLIIY
ncbi:MAG: hypothetical protein ACD_5C00018G0003 [uncultured bacterium]|nr:MAG: hypothetical protein ACD_5C00018G0003 [uncultured bacterium]